MPNDIIKEYDLHEIETKDGYIYVAVFKGMYGLLQSGMFAKELFEERLGKDGNKQSQSTPGM